MNVEDLMTQNVALVRPEQTLGMAAQLMWDCDCGALPVVERDSAKVVGMITDRDICMAAWSRGQAPNVIFVGEVMSREVATCHPDDTIAHAESSMRGSQVRRLPVVDGAQRLIGILSLADIARATDVAPKLGSDYTIPGDGVVTTLASIVRVPRPNAAHRYAAP